MKNIRYFLSILGAFAFTLFLTGRAAAQTFTETPWTNDATSGIASGLTTWAYHFGSTSTPTVNGVPVTGVAGTTVSNGDFDLAGTGRIISFDDPNNVTGSGSSEVAKRFVFSDGAASAAVTVKGLTPGNTYTVTLLSVGWDDDPNIRTVTFTSGSDSRVIKQNQFGNNNGIRIEYTFTAAATTRVINIVNNNPAFTFHLYGLALRPALIVTSNADSGTGSLRETITAAPAGSTITFAPALSGPIVLGSEIVINSEVTLDAYSLTNGLTIDAGPGTNRHFRILPGATATLERLRLTGGNGGGGEVNDIGHGGSIRNDGILTLRECTLSGNTTPTFGGAIFNQEPGTLTLEHCTLSGNSGLSGGGAIQQVSRNPVTLIYCTVANNSGMDEGGGINAPFGPAILNHCTVSGNAVTRAPGNGVGGVRGDVLTVGNSIITGNTDPNSSGIQNITPGFTTPVGTINITDGNAMLARLGKYGGPTQTMPPLPGSPAINAATNSTATTDQRGYPIVGTPDIGAVNRTSSPNISVLGTPDFGFIKVGSKKSLSFTIKNLSTSTLAGLAATIVGTDVSSFTITSSPAQTLSSMGETTLIVQFSPKSGGGTFAALRLSCAKFDDPVDITLTGTGKGPEIAVKERKNGDLKTGKSTVAFGKTSSAKPIKKTFTIKNTGTAALSNLKVSLSGVQKGSFKLNSTNLKTKLNPGASTEFTVTFMPATAASFGAKMKITSNDADENPFVIKLSGTGTSAAKSGTSKLAASFSEHSSALSHLSSTRSRLEPDTGAVWIQGRKYLTLTVGKPAGILNSSPLVEVSPNLVDWYSGPKHTTVIRDDSQYLIVRDNIPVTPGTKRHIRLKSQGHQK